MNFSVCSLLLLRGFAQGPICIFFIFRGFFIFSLILSAKRIEEQIMGLAVNYSTLPRTSQNITVITIFGSAHILPIIDLERELDFKLQLIETNRPIKSIEDELKEVYRIS